MNTLVLIELDSRAPNGQFSSILFSSVLILLRIVGSPRTVSSFMGPREAGEPVCHHSRGMRCWVLPPLGGPGEARLKWQELAGDTSCTRSL